MEVNNKKKEKKEDIDDFTGKHSRRKNVNCSIFLLMYKRKTPKSGSYTNQKYIKYGLLRIYVYIICTILNTLRSEDTVNSIIDKKHMY